MQAGSCTADTAASHRGVAAGASGKSSRVRKDCERPALPQRALWGALRKQARSLLEAQRAELQAEGQRLQAENAKLLSRLQAVDGSRDRSVQDAENRLVDVQVCPDLLTQAL